MLRNSYEVMISGGMTEEKENSLRSRGNLFQEPDSTLLLSSGCGTYFYKSFEVIRGQTTVINMHLRSPLARRSWYLPQQ